MHVCNRNPRRKRYASELQSYFISICANLTSIHSIADVPLRIFRAWLRLQNLFTRRVAIAKGRPLPPPPCMNTPYARRMKMQHSTRTNPSLYYLVRAVYRT
eukprot:5229486-Pyramimonas_sp.AAC.3